MQKALKVIKKTRKAAKKGHRLQNIRNERDMLIIACEDTKSSVLYFQAIFSDLKKNHAISTQSLVIAKHQHTDLLGVLEDLLTHKNYQYFEHKWIIIDRDAERIKRGKNNSKTGHTLENFNQALAKAKKKSVKVAYSNPCFEIWISLHFQPQTAYIDRKNLKSNLKKDHQYNKKELFEKVLNPKLQKQAIKNAQNLITYWKNLNGTINPANDNPSTTIHNLITLLNNFKNEKNIICLCRKFLS